MDARISTDARKGIARRIDGGTSVIVASGIKDGNGLAYAVRFLTDHFTYKRSKGGFGVNTSAAQEAVEAMETALAGFKAEVLGQKTAPAVPPVSPLAEGKIGNPWAYVNA